jgi:hypothetical protein
VVKDDAVLKLEEYATHNKETQGKFTIGDEKKHNPFMRLNVSFLLLAQSGMKTSPDLDRILLFRRL